ncbi:hypothetical protein SAMN05216503_2276 [Polaribacter sp. KT25b]|uniref:hypothetical protein n=1 Tax=Polaribacter sp. KT25b TaxID=1855336 RepID=UPI00087A2C09|nr:hypothetical protein [Polaribacter sp. KT25b]SDS19397.1 hypothetical protein SAMN05216503_2276 [Polaribacter sp. KT25b]
MIYFTTITDCILAIKDNLKVLQINTIRITDLESYQKFCDTFSIDEFRSSIREYRDINGRENLKQELRLILSTIKDYSKFYNENQISLNSMDPSCLLRNLIKPIELKETLAYRKQIPTNKSITVLKGNYEQMSLRFSDEHPEMITILKKINLLEKEKEKLLNLYNEWVLERKILEKKYNNLLSFKFYYVLQKLETIKEIIEEDYIENIEILNLNFNNDLLEIINEYFTRSLTAVSAKDFFNNFELSGLKVEKKKMSDTKLYFLIDSLANTIKDKLQKEKWINTSLDYFEKKRHIYDKKKTYEKEFYEKIITNEVKENHFVNRLSKAIQMI